MVNVMMIDSREAPLRSLVSKKEEVLSIAGVLTRASSILHSFIDCFFHLSCSSAASLVLGPDGWPLFVYMTFLSL